MANIEEFETASSPINQLKKQLRELKGSAAVQPEHLDNISQRLGNLENNFNSLIDVLKQASQISAEDEEIKKKLEEISEQNKVLIEAINELLKLLTTIFKSRTREEHQAPAADLHPKLPPAGTQIVYQRTR